MFLESREVSPMYTVLCAGRFKNSIEDGQTPRRFLAHFVDGPYDPPNPTNRSPLFPSALLLPIFSASTNVDIRCTGRVPSLGGTCRRRRLTTLRTPFVSPFGIPPQQNFVLLFKQNDEAKHRRWRKSMVVGKSNVRSYEDIVKA